ncbi:hypothetical protein [Williamsia sp.]|uniref:hypothetical protein n=1 Tax=Williamsia sp. TaxID=1872085 RepID=UPI002F92D9AB
MNAFSERIERALRHVEDRLNAADPGTQTAPGGQPDPHAPPDDRETMQLNADFIDLEAIKANVEPPNGAIPNTALRQFLWDIETRYGIQPPGNTRP